MAISVTELTVTVFQGWKNSRPRWSGMNPGLFEGGLENTWWRQTILFLGGLGHAHWTFWKMIPRVFRDDSAFRKQVKHEFLKVQKKWQHSFSLLILILKQMFAYIYLLTPRILFTLKLWSEGKFIHSPEILHAHVHRLTGSCRKMSKSSTSI